MRRPFRAQANEVGAEVARGLAVQKEKGCAPRSSTRTSVGETGSVHGSANRSTSAIRNRGRGTPRVRGVAEASPPARRCGRGSAGRKLPKSQNKVATKTLTCDTDRTTARTPKWRPAFGCSRHALPGPNKKNRPRLKFTIFASPEKHL